MFTLTSSPFSRKVKKITTLSFFDIASEYLELTNSFLSGGEIYESEQNAGHTFYVPKVC